MDIKELALGSLGPRSSLALARLYYSSRWKSVCRIRSTDGFYQMNVGSMTLVSPSLAGMGPIAIRQDPADTHCWQYSPTEGDLVVDLGAGFGAESLHFSALVGRSGAVLAVEASPLTYTALTRTLAANGVRNVLPINAAVGSDDGFVQISDDPLTWLKNTTVAGGQGERIRSATLPTLLSEAGLSGRTIALLKCNIEGAERGALQGAGEAVDTIDNMVISCHDFRGQREGNPEFRTYEWVRNWCVSKGFRVTTRADHRSWVADTIYATRASL